jgi:putative Mg2+ transporter-C (MgtC) family protein
MDRMIDHAGPGGGGMDMNEIVDHVGRLLLAAAAGGAIGFEREAHGQAAGFRTYVLVSVASCLMMLLSLHLEELYRSFAAESSVVRLDPGRIASYAIAGMGFLGAGAIIKGKGSVRGLTTAAGLWSATGIGLSIGAGFILIAFATTAIILASLYLAYPVKALSHRRIYTILTVKAATSADLLDGIKALLAKYEDLSLQFVNYRRDITTHSTTYRLRLHHHDKSSQHWSELVRQLSALPAMQEVAWEESDVP